MLGPDIELGGPIDEDQLGELWSSFRSPRDEDFGNQPSETGASSTAPSTTVSSIPSRGMKGNDALRGRLADMREAEAKATASRRAGLPFGIGGSWSAKPSVSKRHAPQPERRRHDDTIIAAQAALAASSSAVTDRSDSEASSPIRSSRVSSPLPSSRV